METTVLISLILFGVGVSLIFDGISRKRNAILIQAILSKLQDLTPCDPPRSHLLLSPLKLNYSQDGTSLANKMRETLIRIKHDAQRKFLLTVEEQEIEAGQARLAAINTAQKKEVQRLIKLIADDFFIDVKKDGDAEATRFSASLFGAHLISVLEGKEADVKENYKPFPRAKAAEIKAAVDSWVNDGCPY